MPRWMLVSAFAALAFALAPDAPAQSTPPHRVGVVFEGGDAYLEMLEGFKAGLRELGLQEGRDYALEIRDLQGDLRAAAEAARALERARVRLIYTMASSVTVAVKEATSEVSIVFALGRDPVQARLVSNPGVWQRSTCSACSREPARASCRWSRSAGRAS